MISTCQPGAGEVRRLAGDLDRADAALKPDPARLDVGCLEMLLDPVLIADLFRVEVGLVFAGVMQKHPEPVGRRAAIALDEQDDGTAEALSSEALDIMHRAELDEHPWAATAWVIHGILLGRRGDLDEAAQAIERGVEFGERLRAWQLTVYASLALAEVRQRQHEIVAARRLLTRARQILEALPDPGNGLERLAKTEKMLRLRPPRALPTGAGPFWELSERELSVVRLLPSGLSQREIAGELYVSFNTMKTHMRSIFAKLGVSSRAEAVERARELGLL